MNNKLENHGRLAKFLHVVFKFLIPDHKKDIDKKICSLMPKPNVRPGRQTL